MTTLGEVLVRLQDRTELCQMLVESGDLLLMSRLDKLAEEAGTDVCDAALDAVFLEESRAAGLLALKGHRALGGMRASLYNAVPQQAVDALVAFMADFARRHG